MAWFGMAVPRFSGMRRCAALASSAATKHPLDQGARFGRRSAPRRSRQSGIDLRNTGNFANGQTSETDNAFSPLVPLAKAWITVDELDFGGFRSLAATIAIGMSLVLSVAQRRGAL